LLQGNLDEAERYLKQALREARRAFDSKDAHVAAALNNLAEVYRC
jgi:ABC-type transporter Mla subunit MlaD